MNFNQSSNVGPQYQSARIILASQIAANGCLPVYMVFIDPSMGCNPIVHVACLHCLSVLFESAAQAPTRLSNVDVVAFGTGDFVYCTFDHFFWSSFFHFHQ